MSDVQLPALEKGACTRLNKGDESRCVSRAVRNRKCGATHPNTREFMLPNIKNSQISGFWWY